MNASEKRIARDYIKVSDAYGEYLEHLAVAFAAPEGCHECDCLGECSDKIRSTSDDVMFSIFERAMKRGGIDKGTARNAEIFLRSLRD